MIRGGALALLMVAGCSAAEPPVLSFDQYLAQCDAIKGKSVKVAGYLGSCGGYDCHVYRDAAGEQAIFAWLRNPHKPRGGDSSPRWIGIKGDRGFDRKAQPFQNSYVVITGRVHDSDCIGEGLDRSYGIEPTDIRAWTPAEGAPGNTQ